MSQSAIPLEFESYLQNQLSVAKGPEMNEMIFAFIEGLDPGQAIDRNTGLPDPALWVHQQDIDQVGKLGPNALAYSVVVPASAPAFTFNAIYLRDKDVPNSCGMVIHKATETKELGLSSTRTLAMEYTGAAELANITVDAATWQIDYQARLKGIEEDHRLACLDNYGHTAFIDGFDVTQQADPNKYEITPGVMYVGGLRGVLTAELMQTVTEKPNGLYVDVVRDGTVLSKWQNQVDIVLSPTEKTDYIDEQGRQHYVAKLAGINADGTVQDWRVMGGLAQHLARSQFVQFDPGRVYTLGEVCYTKDPSTGELRYWQWYSNVESLAGKSPLLEANRHTGWSDNTKPFYWIPYTGDQVGMPFYWLDTVAPEWAVLEINVDLPIKVYWRLARCYPHLISGDTINTGEIRGEFLRVLDQGRGVNPDQAINQYAPDMIKAHTHGITSATEDGGDMDGASGNLTSSPRYNSITQLFGGHETRPRSVARPMAIVI